MLVGVYSDDKNVAASWHPRNRRDGHCNWNVKCRASWGSGGSADFELGGEPEWLVSGRTRDHEGRAVFINNCELNGMFRVRLVPVDLNEPGDREWLRAWPNLGPCTPQKEEEALADFRAIRQEDLSAHSFR